MFEESLYDVERPHTHTQTGGGQDTGRGRGGGAAEKEEEGDAYSRKHRTVAMKHRRFDDMSISQKTKTEALKEQRRRKKQDGRKIEMHDVLVSVSYTPLNREVQKIESTSKTHPPRIKINTKTRTVSCYLCAQKTLSKGEAGEHRLPTTKKKMRKINNNKKIWKTSKHNNSRKKKEERGMKRRRNTEKEGGHTYPSKTKQEKIITVEKRMW